MHPRALWSFAHIALYSGFKYNYVVNVLSAMEGFPKPIRLNGPKGYPRYIAGEVMHFFESRERSEPVQITRANREHSTFS